MKVNQSEIDRLKLQLYHLLISSRPLTNQEINIMYELSKDRAIQEMIDAEMEKE